MFDAWGYLRDGFSEWGKLNCAVVAPEHGALGQCPASLAAGAECAPTCNVGYQLSSPVTCPEGMPRTPGLCEVDVCAVTSDLAVDGQFNSRLGANSSLTITFGRVGEARTTVSAADFEMRAIPTSRKKSLAVLEAAGTGFVATGELRVGEWEVTTFVGGRNCSTVHIPVDCNVAAGFQYDPLSESCECENGGTNDNGKCIAKQDVCSGADLSLSQSRLSAQGSTGRLNASASGPAGLNTTVTAVPVESTVQFGEGVPSADLPITGLWEVSLSVGGKQCSQLTRQVQVRCLDGFVESGGRCVCPPGQTNEGGTCQPGLCVRAASSAWLGADPSFGGNANLTVSLNSSALPSDAHVTVSAVPADTAVQVPTTTFSAPLTSTGDWLINLKIGNETCAPLRTAVTCLEDRGFTPRDGRCVCKNGGTNDNGKCLPPSERKGVCAFIELHAENGRISEAGGRVADNSELKVITTDGGMVDESNFDAMTLEMVPRKNARSTSIASPSKLVGLGDTPTGEYEIKVTDGNVSCTLVQSVTVVCSTGYEPMGSEGKCFKSGRAKFWISVAIGVFLVVCLCALLFVMSRKATDFKQLLTTIMANEAPILLQIASEVIDFVGDTFVFITVATRYRFLSNLFACYVVAYMVACLVSTVGLFLKIKALVQQLRTRRGEIKSEDERTRLEELEIRRVQCERDIAGTYAVALTAMGEGPSIEWRRRDAAMGG